MRIDWRAKALLQRTLSAIPGGTKANYLLQRATRSLPLSEAKVRQHSDIAGQHMEAIRRCGDVAPESATFFEFGAGWDLHVPQALYCLGARRQIVVDIARLARPALVHSVAQQLRNNPPVGATHTIPAISTTMPMDEVLEAMGISYLAPADARNTALESGSIDYITSTNTLEHIPREDIGAILAECRRLIRSGGVASFQIDYQDHYSYFDPDIGPYNYLRFSSRRWKVFNSAIHFQNRLRHDDYLRLVAAAGFEVLDERIERPTEGDLEQLRELPLSANFAHHPLQLLGIRTSLLTLRAP